jgi:hypothetical protein
LTEEPPPHGLDHQGPHAGVADSVDEADPPVVPGTVLAGIAPREFVGLLAIAEVVSVADLGVEGGECGFPEAHPVQGIG